MEILRRIGGGVGGVAVPLLLTCAVVFMIAPEISATRWPVGGKSGWAPNVNYTEWAKQQHFYLGDWLFFVFDRTQQNVLEVNKTDFEGCISDHPLHNWTRGAGRDVVPLNVTKTYYFISGKGFCFSGMKVAIHVEKLPPPPSALPSTDKSGSSFGGVTHMVVRAAFSVVAALALFIPLR